MRGQIVLTEDGAPGIPDRIAGRRTMDSVWLSVVKNVTNIRPPTAAQNTIHTELNLLLLLFVVFLVLLLFFNDLFALLLDREL